MQPSADINCLLKWIANGQAKCQNKDTYNLKPIEDYEINLQIMKLPTVIINFLQRSMHSHAQHRAGRRNDGRPLQG